MLKRLDFATAMLLDHPTKLQIMNLQIQSVRKNQKFGVCEDSPEKIAYE